MKRAAVKLTAIFLVLVFAFSSFSIAVYAADETSGSGDSTVHALVLTCEQLTVDKGKTTTMTATVTNVDIQPVITWASSDASVAHVSSEGVVTGVKEGKATISATAQVGDEKLYGEFVIHVVTRYNLIKNLLEKQQILSYQYSFVDDYYYTNDKEAWQYNFGFGKIYDIASPYLLLEYDYIRVFFTYADKDWMLQMWKGQYGMIFYGGEIGIYNRDHVDDGINEWTFFDCPGEEDWLNMEMTLWHEQLDGTWVREFTREYDKYWWCTGFKNGSLRQQEPADELRLEGRITFLDEEMTQIVAEGLKECGFGVASSKSSLGIDQIYVDGCDISFSWQNISEAESTMFAKVSFGALSAIALMPFWPYLFPWVGLFAILVLGVSAIL